MGRVNYSDAFWLAVEQEHVYNGVTFENLVKKFKVSPGSLSYQSKRRNWCVKKEMQQKHVNGAIVSTVETAGKHNIRCNGKDTAGQNVASGVYLAKLQAGSLCGTIKMTLVG